MTKIKFISPEELRKFYKQQGFFGLYYCTTECSDIEIAHFNLIRSGDGIEAGCFNGEIMNIDDEQALDVIRRFLYTGQVVIHPKIFSL